jgi:hypothetical protein
MEQIKSVTLQSVNHFSDVLASKTEKATKNEIQWKLIDHISSRGKNSFIDLYNKTFSTKNFEEALEIIKI